MPKEFRFTILLLGCALFLLEGLAACNPTSATSLPPASVESQLAGGASIYTQTCATSSCHGKDGEGIRDGNGFSAWPLVGADFQVRHPNAEIVFDVVRSGGEPNLRALTDQQIYDSIAYELSQNHISLQAPLTAANAYNTFGGRMSGDTGDGFYPPLGNYEPAATPPHADLPLSTANGVLRLQVDQIAAAKTIGDSDPPPGGALLMVVFVLADTGQAPIPVGPENLRLTTPGGDVLLPQTVDPRTAIEKFHKQTIQPQHGTAALAIFSLPASDQFDRLIYSDEGGNQMELRLKP
jgi:mono/diheme cytochrome c family protein